MDWLKRHALRWLVRDRRFYDIMCALRGPDALGVDGLKLKEKATAPVRGAVEVNPACGLVLESPPTEYSVPLIATVELVGIRFNYHHFRDHHWRAVAALREAGFLRRP